MISPKIVTMPVGSSAICLRTDSPGDEIRRSHIRAGLGQQGNGWYKHEDRHCLPELSSAPRAATKPSMARRPLIVSGALPPKFMISPKVGWTLAAPEEVWGGMKDGLILLLSAAALSPAVAMDRGREIR